MISKRNDSIGKKVVRCTVIVFACLMIGGSTRIITTHAEEASNQAIHSLSYEEYQEQIKVEAERDKVSASMKSDTTNADVMRTAAELAKGKENVICENVEALVPATMIQASNAVSEKDGIKLSAAPVAGLQPIVLNEDSLKNGQITTDTQLAWLWSFSDEDGDTLLNRYLGGFPSAYYLGNLNNNIGFVTQFSNPGHYTVLYQVMDTSGELSAVVGYEFEVVPVENYQVFENSFTALNEIQDYNVEIDFSEMNTAAICLVNTGKSLPSMTIKDAAGTTLTTMGGAKRWFFINKPAPDATSVSYTISVKAASFDSTASGYRVMVGDKKDVEPMLSGLENTVWLDLYTETLGKNHFTLYTPNKDESWYRFTANGTMVFTLLTYYSQTRFQVRDVNDLTILFDSNDSANADVHKSKFCGPYNYAEKARLTTTIGQDYYLVIYSPSLISTEAIIEKTMNVTVGKPNMLSKTTTAYATSNIRANSSGFSSAVNISVGDNGSTIPRTAVADNIYLKSLDDIKPSMIEYWRVSVPGGTSWYTSKYFFLSIQIGYVKDATTNKNINGIWQMSVRASTSGSPLSFRPGIYIDYHYEIGD
ncbi:hypothetical protein acsn021_17780 [Anaerocolumna cellulosilytica]|uniref:Uncharacterized protein n=1 Tax=Anaerocolumna cellulosilytica TaxID=433286 RepID=A0A6S6QYR6_9FIRM|nr:hypothetical protein [Anaerocolumna cellulosilytica]MBB5194827.1 hypothetical protein [Anaerocolumna cellulosilytica]BCJ94209.1 hypothetical protein acsn021_17780 [Anaerocolumna cellulosilytica]